MWRHSYSTRSSLSTMCLALLTFCSCFKECWLIEPLCYSIFFFFRLRRKWRRIRTSRCFNFQNFLWSWFAEKYLFYVLSAPLRYVKRMLMEKGLKLGHTLRLVLSLLAATTWNHFASKIKSKKADKTTCWYLTRLYILHFPTSCG